MGTHPIFESDFDCLTDFNREIWAPVAVAEAMKAAAVAVNAPQ